MSPKKSKDPLDDEENPLADDVVEKDDDGLEEAGFHLAGEDDEEDAPVVDPDEDEKDLALEGEPGYESGPKRSRPRGSRLIDDFEDHIEDEDEEDAEDAEDQDEEDWEEEDLDDEKEEDWDDEDGDEDEER